MATGINLAIAAAVTAALVVTALQWRPKQEIAAAGPPAKVIVHLPEGLQSLTPYASADRQPDAQVISPIDAGSQAYQHFFRTGSSLYLDLAGRALQPWRDDPTPPLDIWLLRARIAQAEHRFEAAAAELTGLLLRHPGHSEAQLLAADARRRAGQLEEARRHCTALGLAGWQLEAALCGADIMMTAGAPQRALALVESVRPQIGSLPRHRRVWATAVAADTLAANGNTDVALDLWASVPDWSSLPLSYKLSLADLLLAQEKHQPVSRLLEDERAAPGVLVRRWRAAVDSPSQRRALAARLREQELLLRESPRRERHLMALALMALWVENDPDRALDLALENWHYQRSHEDARLVFTAASRAGEPAAAAAIRTWQGERRARLVAGRADTGGGTPPGGLQL